MFLLHALEPLTTEFFYTLTFLGSLWVLILPSDCPSSLFFAGSPSNMCARMMLTELFFHKKLGFLFFYKTKCAFFLLILRFSSWLLFSGKTSCMRDWAACPSLVTPKPLSERVTWISQGLLHGLCYLRGSDLKAISVFYLSLSSLHIVSTT